MISIVEFNKTYVSVTVISCEVVIFGGAARLATIVEGQMNNLQLRISAYLKIVILRNG